MNGHTKKPKKYRDMGVIWHNVANLIANEELGQTAKYLTAKEGLFVRPYRRRCIFAHHARQSLRYQSTTKEGRGKRDEAQKGGHGAFKQ